MPPLRVDRTSLSVPADVFALTLECKVKRWDTETGYFIGEIVGKAFGDGLKLK